ncbi:MAG: mechanosensitive ion channel family protein [Bacteroidetes bacterium]|nr:mechanosensitive ion channel family protein [Bacteroidota bacterium]
MTELIEKYLGMSTELQNQLLISVFIIFVMWLILRLTLKFVINKIDVLPVRYQWKKFTTYIAVALSIVFLSQVWLGAFGSLGTFLGLLSAGLAIALKDLLINMVGWAFILIRKPFKVGDRVEIGSVSGDVVDIRIFQFSLMEIGNWVDADQSTGRIIHVPNGIVFIQPQANYTEGFAYIWHEVPVLITFESNWKKAKAILNEILDKHALHLSPDAEKQVKEASKRFLIYYKVLTPIVYTEVKDSGVLLTMRFMCDPRRRRVTQEIIWEAVLDEFTKCDDIDFAYPTQRFYDNRGEGKSGTKPQEA